MKIRCLECDCAMVFVKGKYICSNYNKGLLFRCKHSRFTITLIEIQEILDLHGLDDLFVKEFKINHKNHYQIIMCDGSIKYNDGTTIVL